MVDIEGEIAAFASGYKGGSAFMLASTVAPGIDRGIRPALWRMKDDSLGLLWCECTSDDGN